MSRDLDEKTEGKKDAFRQETKDRFKEKESRTDKKTKSRRVKSQRKKRNNTLKFDDEPVLTEREGYKEKRASQGKVGRKSVYDATSVISHIGNEALHTSDVGEADDNNTSKEALDSSKYFAGRKVLGTDTKRGLERNDEKRIHRLRFESDADSPKSQRRSFSEKKNDSTSIKASKKERVSRNKKIQKRRLKSEYAKSFKAAKAGESLSGQRAGSKAFKSVASSAKEVALKLIRNNAPTVVILCVIGIVVITVVSVFGTAGSLFSQMGGAIVGSTFLSADNEMLSANAAYEDMETELQAQLDRIETDYPGYDEYRYEIDELTHDPYALTSYLTATYGSYAASDVASELELLFKEQFKLVITETTETRTRPNPTSSNPDAVETYDVKILIVNLTNNGFDAIARARLDSNHLAHYSTLLACLGNRPDLFGDISYGNVAGGGIEYDIPPEALGDARFANMIREAERHLGTPYVWGGYAPGGFDCSGFVSYVINNCGNGWSFGRQTANGLMGKCAIISPGAAQPGDLIFFERTYNTAGASHVGIYVGNGMMIHCGKPVQYTSINSNYWQSHFLCYGRLP